MIVCSCNTISSSTIQDFIACGANDPETIMSCLGYEFECGVCREAMAEMISERIKFHEMEKDHATEL